MRVLDQDAGDHKGPLHSTALAPTAQTASHLHSRLKLMPIWRPSRVPASGDDSLLGEEDAFKLGI